MSHVVHVLPGFGPPGGAEGQLIELARGLAARDWRVTVVALSLPGGEAAQRLAEAGVGFLTLEMGRGLADPRGWLRFRRWLRRERPEIVHAHLPHAAWFARWSRLTAPVRVQIDTIHTAATGTSGRRWGYRLSGWLPTHTTAVSHAAAEAWLEARMVRAERLSVLPNGVDTHRFRPDPARRAETRARLGLRDEFLWFTAGRLVAVKDYATLLRAFALLPRRAHLAIAGEGPMAGELRGLARELGVADRVHLLGFEDHLETLYPAADGFVLSSLWEGMPVALLEAGATGLPAVATPAAGAAEVLAGGEGGLLALAIGNAAALAEPMHALMELPAETRVRMGQAARRRVVELYGLDGVLERWEALYDELLRRNPKPRPTGKL